MGHLVPEELSTSSIPEAKPDSPNREGKEIQWQGTESEAAPIPIVVDLHEDEAVYICCRCVGEVDPAPSCPMLSDFSLCVPLWAQDS